MADGSYHVASIDADKIGINATQAYNTDTQNFISNLGLGTYPPAQCATVLVLTAESAGKINKSVITNLLNTYGENADFIYNGKLASGFTGVTAPRTYTFE